MYSIYTSLRMAISYTCVFKTVAEGPHSVSISSCVSPRKFEI